MFGGPLVAFPMSRRGGAARHLKPLQVKQEDPRQAAQHVVYPVRHGAAAATLARLGHLLVLQLRNF